MGRAIIRQGDSTSHGGTVIGGSLADLCEGKPIAFVGHKVSCPKCRGIHEIIEGAPVTTLYGKGVALEGMRTSCGATLIATQFVTTVEISGGGGGGGGAYSRPNKSSGVLLANASNHTGNRVVSGADDLDDFQDAQYDEQIQFVNAKGAKLDGVRYELKLADGTTMSGVTDVEGRTQRVVTDSPQAVQEVTLKPKALEGCCSVHAENSGSEGTPITFTPAGVATNPTDIGSSVKQVSTPKGEARGLTSGEIAMARQLFGSSIDYNKVKVHNGEYLWLGLQPNDTAMTPNGEMYFNPTRFQEDFSASSEFGDRLWFMHEMVHVWQYQLGYPVKMRGALRIGLSYKYALNPGLNLSDYNMEAQGNVLSDYWAEVLVGDPPALWQGSSRGMKSDFQRVLATFISNPSDKRNLPGGE